MDEVWPFSHHSELTRCCGSTSQHDNAVLRLQVQQWLASRWVKKHQARVKTLRKTKPNFGFTVNSVPTKTMQNERWMIEELEFKWVYPLSQRSADQLECFCWKSWTDERFREVRIRLVCFSERGKHLLFFSPSLKIKVLSSPQDLNVKSYWVEYTQCHAEIPSVKLENDYRIQRKTLNMCRASQKWWRGRFVEIFQLFHRLLQNVSVLMEARPGPTTREREVKV